MNLFFRNFVSPAEQLHVILTVLSITGIATYFAFTLFEHMVLVERLWSPPLWLAYGVLISTHMLVPPSTKKHLFVNKFGVGMVMSASLFATIMIVYGLATNSPTLWLLAQALAGAMCAFFAWVSSAVLFTVFGVNLIGDALRILRNTCSDVPEEEPSKQST